MSARDLTIRFVGLLLGAFGVATALNAGESVALLFGACVLFGFGIVLLLHGDGTR